MNYFEKALSILEIINSSGYEAYIVGGAVRDYLLKLDLNDIDITTNMPLDEIKNKFKIKENGALYDSITIIDEYNFEITHFRKDISYQNHRHPIVEETNDLNEDLKRRDFTMNALLMNKDKLIIDKYDGINDINNRLIKMIGDPLIRFEEDSLRILRALHFSSKLNFKIEENTLKAMVLKKNLLAYLSFERLEDYLYKIGYSKYKNGINYINEYDLFSYIPKFKNMLSLINSFEKDELEIAYYFKYNDYFSNKKDIKKKIELLNNLINNNFDDYSLYQYGHFLNDYKNIIKNLNFDFDNILNRYNNLSIKLGELDIDNLELSKLFKGKDIAIKREEVIKAILKKKLKNKRDEILNFLNR